MDYLRKSTNYLIIGGVLLFIIFASYSRGLFFDKDLYLIETIFSIMFLFYLIINFKDLVNVFNRPYLWALISIDLLYLIMSFFAINQLYALQQSFRWILASQLFILVLLIKDKKWVNELIWFSLLFAGIWTSIFGWLAAYNLVDFKDAFWTNRISSVFQYPNTFGAFLAAILIGILIRSTSNKWFYSLSSVASYLLTLTIIFTYSRGTWLVLLIVWLIALFFLSFKQQILFVIHTLLIGIALILTLPSMTDTITNATYLEGFLIISATSLSVALIYFFINYFANKTKVSTNKFIRLIIPVLAIIGMLGGLYAVSNPKFVEKLPDTLELRVKDINFSTYSVQERTLFYKDSLELIKDGPLFGHGGGAWKELYKSYQSYPYESSQAHNFYSQLTVEIGMIGLIIFISFILLIIISIIRNRKNLDTDGINSTLSYGFMIFLLLYHSFIDFNMSYGYILVLVMILLAMIASPMKHQFYNKALKQEKVAYLIAILIILMSFFSVAYTAKFYYADKQLKDLNNLSTSQIEEKVNKSVSLNPYNLEYRFLKIDLYQQLYNQSNVDEHKQNVLTEAVYIRDLDLKNPDTTLKLSQVMATNGYLKDSVEILENGIEYAPWQKELYEQYFIYTFNLAKYYQQNGNTEDAQILLSKILYYYDDILNKRKFLDQQNPTLQYKSFDSTEGMKLYVGQTHIVFGDYSEGLKYLIPLTKSKDQNIKENALIWTAYAYEKQNMQDKAKEYMNLKGFNINKYLEIKAMWK